LMPSLREHSKLKLSSSAWQLQLSMIVKSSSPTNRLAIVGVGHPLRGDDYAGSYIVRKLMDTKPEKVRDGIVIFDAEADLEAMFSKISALSPKHVIFIDTCEMGAEPGQCRLLSVSSTSYPFFTTHGVPLKLLAEQLLPDSKAWILAIQPEQTNFDSKVSPEVREISDSIAAFLRSIIREGKRIC